MNARHLCRFAAIVALALVLGACSDSDPYVGRDGGPEIDVASPSYGVFQLLKASGYQAEVTDRVDEPFFDDPGYVFTVNGRRLEVFEFDSPKDVQAVKSSIVVSGSSVRIGDESAELKPPVRFYSTDRVIIIFPDADAQMNASLDYTLGTPFAMTR